MDLATKDYTVTEAAGPKVAGQRVEPGDTLALTEAQARAERLAGAIVLKGREEAAAKAAEKAADPKRLAEVQARARAEDAVPPPQPAAAKA